MKNSRLQGAISEVLGRYDVVFPLVAGGISWKVGAEYLALIQQSPTVYSAMIGSLGVNAPAILSVLNVLSGAAICFVTIRAIHNYFANALPDEKQSRDERRSDSFAYDMPVWPSAMTGKLNIVVGEEHEQDGTYVPKPAWYTLPENGLFGNIGVFGSIGTGKTASFAYPALRQFFEYRSDDADFRFGGLIMDVKGDFFAATREMARDFGRLKDLIAIKPGGRYKWNPIHSPHLDAEVLAGRLVSVYENMTGDNGGGDSAWITQGVLKLLTHSIGVYRFAFGYVTIRDIDELISASSVHVEEGEDPVLAQIFRFAERVEERILKGVLNEGERRDYEYHSRFFTNEWRYENPKNKATVISAATIVTGLFSKPEIAKTFCPKEKEIDFPGFDEVINSGFIVGLDMPDSRYGVMAQAIGTMLKLEFQRSALGRVSRRADDPTTNTKRPLLFMADEYQNFVSSGGKGAEGDDAFYALSRQSRCVSIVLTQSPVSLESKIGETKSRVILASLRTKVFLALTDPKDAELAASMCGKDWIDRETSAYQEQIQSASWSPINNTFSGKGSTVSQNLSYSQQHSHIIEPVMFQRLRLFEAIVVGFNGVQQREPWKIYLKPDFAIPELERSGYRKRSTPHNLIISTIKGNM